MNPDPLDVCYCGDPRRDHVNGTGRCHMPDDLTHGFQPCLKFRLSETAQQRRERGIKDDEGRIVPPHGSGPDNQ